MDAFAPLLLIALIADSAFESFKLISEKKANLPHYATFGLSLLILAVTQTNLLALSGLNSESASNLYWYVSYFLGALILMRGSGAVHDLYRTIKSLRDTLNA